LAGTNLRDFDGGTQKIYQRMIEAMDAQIGRVLEALDANGVTGNTIVIFTSDNGGERFAAVDHRQHGAAQSLGPPNIRIGLKLINGPSDEIQSGLGVHRPMRDEQGAGSGVHEGARKTGQCVGARPVALAGGGVAGGKQDPIGVEFQLRDLGGRGQAPALLRVAISCASLVGCASCCAAARTIAKAIAWSAIHKIKLARTILIAPYIVATLPSILVL